LKKKILITGTVGFIGFSFALKLLQKGHDVVGVDNFDDYYSVKLKKNRLKELKKFKSFKIVIFNIENFQSFKSLNLYKFDHIFHFAAQAGVRYSIINPDKYINTNILGTINLFKFASEKKIRSIFFASSSSVYGDSKKFPLSENSQLFPKNIYATSKMLNEITARFFSKNYNMSIIGLRFFTIYGEWGRPDMLLFKIFKCSLNNKKLELNNNGNHFRDFTYIGDVVEILYKLMNKKIKKKYNIFNICSNNPQHIKKVINYFRKNISSLKVINQPKNLLDVYKTHGSNKKIKKLLNFKSFLSFNIGMQRTFEWYKKKIKN
jgi:UDP-glucuronate 4-epimerase